jgi:ATP-independent RNA helicase DbpA
LSNTDFSSLELNAELLGNLKSLDYKVMTLIQAKSLPDILAGKDIIGQAKTGSGKTAAFALGLLQKLEIKQFKVQALVLCPTRELADQVANEIRRLARTMQNVKITTLCGGTPLGPQISSLKNGTHIVVGTPGRIDDHLRKASLDLGAVKTLVLDEADRMLEMGFQDTLDAIVAKVPVDRQTLLFSATFPEEIQRIVKRFMRDPQMVKVASTHDNSVIRQQFYKVNSESHRLIALRMLLLQFKPESSLVFCNTKRETQEVAEQLQTHGFSVLALHGDLEQRDRDQTLIRFSNKSALIMVATDVAARGLDIDGLDAVFNYEIARDTEVHVHRIGRTGRAGRTGLACTLYTEQEDYKVALLENTLGYNIRPETLPANKILDETPARAKMSTLILDGGKKQKIRPGDILGALTGDRGIEGNQVGKILINENRAFVAIDQKVAHAALNKLNHGKLKGRSIRARLMRG